MSIEAEGEHPVAIEITFDNGAGGCRIYNDGRFETWGTYTPDRAAKELWEAVGGYVRGDVTAEPIDDKSSKAIARAMRQS